MYSTILFTTVLLVGYFASAESQSQNSTRGACSGQATYSLSFNYRWTSKRFSNRPGNAHFSPLVSFSHTNRFSAFSRYGYASPGVQSVAETGSTSAIRKELNTAKNRGQVLDIQIDNNIPDGDGAATVQVKVNCQKQFVSAISMVAPSPDWFVAAFRRNMVKDGKFVDRVGGKLKVWDAGTDAGSSFNSRNEVSSPVENIAPLAGPAFNGREVGRFVLQKMK